VEKYRLKVVLKFDRCFDDTKSCCGHSNQGEWVDKGDMGGGKTLTCSSADSIAAMSSSSIISSATSISTTGLPRSLTLLGDLFALSPTSPDSTQVLAGFFDSTCENRAQ